MFVRKLVTSAIVAFSLPMIAHAADLTLVNNTNQDSTSIINNFKCSSVLLGKDGVTKAHSTHILKSDTVKLACILNRSNCKADVYMTNNCSGPVVATIYLDVSSGVKSITVKEPSYAITGNGFLITVDGGSLRASS